MQFDQKPFHTRLLDGIKGHSVNARSAVVAFRLERVLESATTGNKHHLLFVGPRGTGKTHLVTLLVHRLSLDRDIEDRLAIAWLNEDETSTTLLEFLRRIYLALNKRYPADYSLAALEPIYDLDADTAERQLGNLLLERLQDRTLLVVLENLDALFEGLGEPGQQRLRAFIQENPVWSIVATAQRLVDDLSKRKSVFFGFFQTESLVTLSVEEAAEMLGKIAKLRQQADAAAFLSTPTGRSRIQALHHLSGGNHRIYIVLSQFITRDSMDALVGPFAKMIDEMTPYYQERIRWLPAQQRKIVEYLCTCERPVPVKDLARRLFATPQTISSQLKDLREKGYVLSAQRGRESLYEMAEPLMRLCVEVKENQTDEPMRLLVDFLRVWYDERGLSVRLQDSSEGSTAHTYYLAAMDKNTKFGNLRKQLLVDGFRAELGEEQKKLWLPLIESAMQESEELAYAIGEEAKGHIDEAIAAYSAVMEMPDASINVVARAFIHLGIVYGERGDYEKAIADFTSVIDLPNAPVESIASTLYNRGVAYGRLGDSEKEIADYTAVINLPSAHVEQIVDAFYNRGLSYGKMGNIERAIADYTIIIDMPNISVEQIAKALYNRGVSYGELGDDEMAIADYTAVIDLPKAPTDQITNALYNRGVTYGQMGDSEKEIADYTAIIDLPNLAVEQIKRALVSRGIAYGEHGDHEKAIADYNTVINLTGAPIEEVARALNGRSWANFFLDRYDISIADFTTIINTSGMSNEQIASALNGRSWVYSEIGELEKAIADYTTLIELPNIPMENVVLARYSRGVELLNIGEIEKSIEDLNTVINSRNTPAEYVARALSFRGIAHLRLNLLNNSEQDFEATLRLVADIPIEFRVAFNVGAHIALAEIRIATGQWDYAISTLAEGLKQGAAYYPPHFSDSTNILKAFFDSGLAPAIRRERARQLAQIYQDYNAVPHLGEALTRHVGSLYRNVENLPASDNLEQWACAWEEAGKDLPAFRLPLRIFRTGIDFLKTGGNDRGVLLDLKQEERKILQQALGLDA